MIRVPFWPLDFKDRKFSQFHVAVGMYRSFQQKLPLPIYNRFDWQSLYVIQMKKKDKPLTHDNRRWKKYWHEKLPFSCAGDLGVVGDSWSDGGTAGWPPSSRRSSRLPLQTVSRICLHQIHPVVPNRSLNGIVRPLRIWGREQAHSIRYDKLEARQVYFINFYDKVSREGLKRAGIPEIIKPH